MGTFQYFAARGASEGTRRLADYAIARHYSAAALAKQLYRALLDCVIVRQVRPVVQWMLLGFIHGVMNTDNTSISGETKVATVAAAGSIAGSAGARSPDPLLFLCTRPRRMRTYRRYA